MSKEAIELAQRAIDEIGKRDAEIELLEKVIECQRKLIDNLEKALEMEKLDNMQNRSRITTLIQDEL